MRRVTRPSTTKKAWAADRQRDIELAHKRLGTLDARCRWLLDDFTARDPDTLSTTERALWRDNLFALTLGPRPGADPRWVTMYEQEPLDEHLHGLWQRVVALTSAHRASVWLPRLGAWLGRSPPGAAPSPGHTSYVRLGRGYKAEDFETALLHAIADLLIACERLRECPECHRLFVARRRQERHPTCARKARDARRPSRQKKGSY